MKFFDAPMMKIQRLAPEDVFTASDCRTEALGCDSCYDSAAECDDYNPCPADTRPCPTDW